MSAGGVPAQWLRPVWPVPAQVHALVTTRAAPPGAPPGRDGFDLGLQDDDGGAAGWASRALLARLAGLPAPAHWLRQVHGRAVWRAQGPAPAQPPAADAAVTDAPGVALAVLSADCLPVLFSHAGGAIAAAHAGWRGLAAGVLEATLAALAAPPGEVVAWLGPCIGAASYEVGAEVRAAFLARDAGAGGCFTPTRPGHWHCDLAALARRRLAAAGVQRIHGGDFDTRADPRFHSFRRAGTAAGRMATLIWRTAR